MDELKKTRTVKARQVTRRVNELLNGVKIKVSEEDISEKIKNVKEALSELGTAHDEVVAVADDGSPDAPAAVEAEEAWYYEYDKKVNQAVKEGRSYVLSIGGKQANQPSDVPYKLKKLECPKFSSNPKDFHRWRETFERFTSSLSDEAKYDYLFTHTEGEAHTFVANRRSYSEAIKKLEEKYGNVHDIVAVLVNEIKCLSVTRRGDFRTFESLSLKVNDFHDRLLLMNKASEVENSYILKEIESKLCPDDYQRWLESRGDDVDNRSVKHLLTWMETQTRLRRIVGQNSKGSPITEPSPPPPPPRRPPGYVSNSEVIMTRCFICSSTDHVLEFCPLYLRLTLNQRWERLKRFRACFLCLRTGHRRQECTQALCEVCSGPHHTTLHNYQNQTLPPLNNQAGGVDSQGSGPVTASPFVFSHVRSDSAKSGPRRCFLPNVQVNLRKLNKEGDKIQANAALDSHSELNVITPRMCELLNLVGSPINVSVIGAGGVTTNVRSKLVEVFVVDLKGQETRLECVVLQKVCGRSLRIQPEVVDACVKASSVDASKLVTEGQEVDILIGMTSPELHQQLSTRKLPNGLSLVDTRFGPCLVGPAPAPNGGNYENGACRVTSLCLQEPEGVDDFRDFLQCELAGVNAHTVESTPSRDDILFEKKMEVGMVHDSDGHLVTELPWNCDPNDRLDNNRSQAVQSDMILMRRLKKDPVVYSLFREVVDFQISEGIWKEVKPEYPQRYLPLITVVDMERETSKVRVCLDAKRKFNGVSLNDALMKGTVESVDIFEALTKARCGKYIMVGDMSKMFWQVKISEKDQRFHGIICDGRTFVFTRVCYGDKPIPAIADYSMRKIALSGKEEFPLASSVIRNKRYVDDIQEASSNIQELITSRKETDALLGKFGFSIKEWKSNSPLIGQVKEKNKILGMRWNAITDRLSSSTGKKEVKSELTKGNVLSTVAGVWDPVGMFAGVQMTGKLIFQSTVRKKVTWDVLVSDEDLVTKWLDWISDLTQCCDVDIPRSILPSNVMKDPVSCMLVGFCDGSSVAHGCTLYLRWADKDEKNIEVKFLGAKGKVNPIKGTTTPRAEMSGAFLLSRLCYSAEMALAHTELKSKVSEKILFSDSTTVIAWTKSAAIKYKPAIRNKIIEMQELHPVNVWKYTPRANNTTADLISKGCSKYDLDHIIKGPEFLYTPRSCGNFDTPAPAQEEIDAESVPTVLPQVLDETEDPIDISSFSSWKRLTRVTAYVFKFGSYKEKGELKEDEALISDLTKEDIRRAECYWIRKAQQSIEEEKVKNLVPFLDKDGVLRANGRLRNSDILDDEQKFPIILPKCHAVSELIVHQTHQDIFHPGHSRVIAEVRKKYWIVGLRSIAKRIGRNCTICRRWRGMCLEQQMSDLPKFRITPSPPFDTTMIDYVGPFEIKVGYRAQKKVYGAIFSCSSSRAVHVELITDLSTDKFLLGLRRFISLYGQPSHIRSDNGRNFVGAANEIKRMLRRWQQNQEERDELRDFCNERGIKWTFSTPSASHHNGVVEAMVKSVKLVLNKIVRQHVLARKNTEQCSPR